MRRVRGRPRSAPRRGNAVSRPSAAERAAAALREGILSGRFRPHERLVEAKLAAQLGVSHVPVREALRMLAAENLVVIVPRRGASVRAFSIASQQEMLIVRSTLESLNARLAVRRCTPALLRDMSEVLAAGNAAVMANRLVDVAALNGRFHELLAAAVSNGVLGDMMRSLREKTSALAVDLTPAAARRLWKDHAEILEAIIAGDADLAGTLAEQHVLRAAGHGVASPAEPARTASVRD